MKSIILYTTTQDSPIAHPVRIGERDFIFIRAELHEGDTLQALDHAKPLAGETVLNSIPYMEGRQG